MPGRRRALVLSVLTVAPAIVRAFPLCSRPYCHRSRPRPQAETSEALTNRPAGKRPTLPWSTDPLRATSLFAATEDEDAENDDGVDNLSEPPSQPRTRAPAVRRTISAAELDVLSGADADVLSVEREAPDSGVRCHTDTEFRWYVIQVYTSFERYAANVIENRCVDWGVRDRVDKVVVPVRQVPQTVGRSVRTKDLPMYPGYVYVSCKMNEVLRDRVNNIPKVVGFVGIRKDQNGARIPDPMPRRQVERIFANIAEAESEPVAGRIRGEFGIGDMVEITKGPYRRETGALRIVRDGEFVVRLYAFGKRMDVSVPFDAVRKLTEEEILAESEAKEAALSGSYASTYANRDRNGPLGAAGGGPGGSNGPVGAASAGYVGTARYERDIQKREQGPWSGAERRVRREQGGGGRDGAYNARGGTSPAFGGESGSGGGRGYDDAPRPGIGRMGRPLVKPGGSRAAAANAGGTIGNDFFDSLNDLLDDPNDGGDDAAGSGPADARRGRADVGAGGFIEDGVGGSGDGGGGGMPLAASAFSGLDLEAEGGGEGEDDGFFEALMRELKAPAAGDDGAVGDPVPSPQSRGAQRSQRAGGASVTAVSGGAAGRRRGGDNDDADFGISVAEPHVFDLDLDMDLDFEKELSAFLDSSGSPNPAVGAVAAAGGDANENDRGQPLSKMGGAAAAGASSARLGNAGGGAPEAAAAAGSAANGLSGFDGDAELESLLAELERGDLGDVPLMPLPPPSPFSAGRGGAPARRREGSVDREVGSPPVRPAAGAAAPAAAGIFTGMGADATTAASEGQWPLISDFDLLPPAAERTQQPRQSPVVGRGPGAAEPRPPLPPPPAAAAVAAAAPEEAATTVADEPRTAAPPAAAAIAAAAAAEPKAAAGGAAAAAATETPAGGRGGDPYKALKVAELKEACRSRGLPVGGKKQDLLERLAAADGG